MTATLHLPIDLVQEIQSLSTESEAFVIEAIREKIAKTQKKRLQQELAEAYQATRQEDRAIVADFETIDFENI